MAIGRTVARGSSRYPEMDLPADLASSQKSTVGNIYSQSHSHHFLSGHHTSPAEDHKMNPIRPLFRTALRTRLATPSVASLSRRTLVTPTSPAQAKVSEVSMEQRVVEDPGEFDEGDHIAGEGEGGEGESPMCNLVRNRSDI